MPELVPKGFVFHQSNLQAFQTCRFSFLLRYIRKLPWPAPLTPRKKCFDEDLFAGSTLHSLIHQFFLGLDPQVLVSCAEHYPDPRVSGWFDNFLKSPYAIRADNSFPEHSLQITLKGRLLLAKFDLISFQDDLTKICDWKTSRTLPKRHFLQDRIQTMVYTLVAARSQAEISSPISMHYWEAGFPDQPIVFAMDDPQIANFEETLSGLLECITSLGEDQFERTKDLKKCAFCDYQSYCARVGTQEDEESSYDWFGMGSSENLEQAEITG